MKIVIKSPAQVKQEQVEHLEMAIKLLENGEKYNIRLRRQLQWRLYQIHKLEKLLGPN